MPTEITIKQSPTHRIMMTLRSDHPHQMSHGEALYIIWKFISPSKYWHKQEVKPYVWDAQPTSESTFQVMFSSMQKGDTERFMRTIESMPGGFVTEKGMHYRVLSAQYLPNVPTDGKGIHITSLNGCQCFRKHTNPVTRKKSWRLINSFSEPHLFAEKIKSTLLARAKRFFPEQMESVKPEEVHIRFLRPASSMIPVHYQNANITTQFVTFQLVAPAPVQKAALYGGIGKEPSSGFGFVLPA